MVPNEDKKKFLTELEETGNILVACKRTGVARTNIYRWRKNQNFNKKFGQALGRGRSMNCEIAEAQLVVAAKRGDSWAIRYLLDNNSRRYLKPRKPWERKLEPDRGPMQFHINLDPKAIEDDLREKYHLPPREEENEEHAKRMGSEE